MPSSTIWTISGEAVLWFSTIEISILISRWRLDAFQSLAGILQREIFNFNISISTYVIDFPVLLRVFYVPYQWLVVSLFLFLFFCIAETIIIPCSLTIDEPFGLQVVCSCHITTVYNGHVMKIKVLSTCVPSRNSANFGVIYWTHGCHLIALLRRTNVKPKSPSFIGPVLS